MTHRLERPLRADQILTFALILATVFLTVAVVALLVSVL